MRNDGPQMRMKHMGIIAYSERKTNYKYDYFLENKEI